MSMTVQLLSAAAGLLLATPPVAADQPVSPKATASHLTAVQPQGKFMWHPSAQTIKLATRLDIRVSGETPRERADRFIAIYGAQFGVTSAQYLRAFRGTQRTSSHYRQLIDGQPVFDRSIVITENDGGTIVSVTSDLTTVKTVVRAQIDENRVRRIAVDHLNGTSQMPASVEAASRIEKGWVVLGDTATAVVDVSLSRGLMHEFVKVRIDARTGTVLSIRDQLVH